MKKNTMMKIASVLLIAVLLTTCVISGTFAKYTSATTGSDTARVASWDITVNDTEISVSSATTVAFNLFNYTDDAVDVNGALDNAKVIAPGTTGQFSFKIQNNSEVDAKYTISFSETNTNNIPLQYSVDGTTWKDSLAELTMTALTDVAIEMNGDNDTQTIYWRWVFEETAEGPAVHAGQTDSSDTALGINGQYEVTIAASITVTQVDA